MKIKLSKEEARQMLKMFQAPHFTNTRNYITVCRVDEEWVKEILPPPLEMAEPIVTFALSKGDQFAGLVCGVQCKYGDLVGDWGLAYVMDTDFAVIYGREGLAEPKKLGVTQVQDDGKRYIGTISRFGQEVLRIEADIKGPGPEGMGSGSDDPDLVGAHFEVHLKRCGKPSHLFTKEEIGTLMRSADDRKRNILVIDEDGTARIIQDTTMKFLYPVRHEAWEPRNNYVGKYSTLSTLDTTYLQSLQGWLGYLESGQRQYMDYTHSEQNIDHLIEKIGNIINLTKIEKLCLGLDIWVAKVMESEVFHDPGLFSRVLCSLPTQSGPHILPVTDEGNIYGFLRFVHILPLHLLGWGAPMRFESGGRSRQSDPLMIK